MPLLATAVGEFVVLGLVTVLFAHAILDASWLSKVPSDLLAGLTVIVILLTMVHSFLAFFRGRRDASWLLRPLPTSPSAGPEWPAKRGQKDP